MAEDLSRFIGDPTDQPAPDSTVTPELLTKLDNLIANHPALVTLKARVGLLEDDLAGLVVPAEIHVRPQDPNELGEVLPTDEAPATT